MKSLRHSYQIGRILSLDVAAGALATGSMIAMILEVKMPVVWYVVLPACVWMIYTLDHLLDARRLKATAHTERHLFHHRHFKVLSSILMIIGILTALASFLWLPLRIIYFGLGMVCLVILHLCLVSIIKGRISKWFQKELGVALIYAIGVAGGPGVLIFPAKQGLFIGLCIQLIIIAATNLLMYAMYELEIDQKDGQTSFVRAIGTVRTQQILKILSILYLLITFILCTYFTGVYLWVGQFLFAIMLGIHLWMSLKVEQFEQKQRYRIWGDALFILPVLGIIFLSLL